MKLKKAIVAFTAIVVILPLSVSAQSSDQVILDLLASLDGATLAPVTVAASTSTAIVAPKPASVAVPVITTPKQEVLTPFHLFNVDGNAPKTDPNVEAMKFALQSLIAQLASLSAGMSIPQVATTTATTTAASSTKDAAPVRKLYKKDLKLGSRGDEVQELQIFLIARRLLFGEATGYFGILTKTALVSFQSEQGLPAVGTVGPKTRALLNALPIERVSVTPPIIPFGPVSIPFIASSTSISFSASTTAGTSSPQTGTSTPLFDLFAPPVSVSMTILPTEAPVGGSVAVTWLSQNATSCEASDGWDGLKSSLGAATIQPLQFSLNLVLTCTGLGGIASTSALVVVGGEQ